MRATNVRLAALLVAASAVAACDGPSGVAPDAFVYSAVTAGGEHSCGLATDGGVFCWGAGERGELGDSALRSNALPVRARLTRTAVEVSAGQSHTCAISSDYELWCWGWNGYGQLGLGTDANQGVPVRVEPVRAYATVSSGWYHGCALTPDGTAYCWGRNDQGQLGTGTFAAAPVPAAVVGGLRFRSIAAGGFHTCGVTLGDDVYCWGLNQYGQLGNGSTISSAAPVRTAAGEAVLAVSAGATHSCAITVAGRRVLCWGSSSHGELGTGDVSPPGVPGSAVPAFVDGLSAVLALSAGTHVTCVSASAVPLCWGRGEFGQLGLGSRRDHARPQRTGEIDLLLISLSVTGQTHACGVSPAGGAYCWGEGATGQLGTGRSVALQPVRIQGSERR